MSFRSGRDGSGWQSEGFASGTPLPGLLSSIPGLTFVSDFTLYSGIDADLSEGNAAGIFTSARSATAPASYYDATGKVIISTTSDIPLFDQGYYDATGFHAKPMGYHAWRSSQNTMKYSGVFDNGVWTKTSSTAVADGIGVDGNSAYLLTATSDGGLIKQQRTGLTNSVYTASVYIKRKTGTGVITMRAGSADGDTDVTASVSSAYWTRVSAFRTPATTSPFFEVKLATSGDAVWISCAQTEPLPYMSPYIPTTDAELTRAGDVLKYENAGNSTAAEETIFIKFTPGITFANDGVERTLCSTDTKKRNILKITSGTALRGYANNTDNTAAVASGTVNNLGNTSYVVAMVVKHSSPYVSLYSNGVLDDTYSGGDWTDPAWGTYAYVGSTNAGTNQVNGNIASIVRYNRALNSTEFAYVSSLLAN